MLGMKEYDPKMRSKRFDQGVANIRESCKDDPPGTFTHFMENYKDDDYFSCDTDEKIDGLIVFTYIGNTAMQQSVLMGSRSRSGSESSGEAPPPQPPPVDLTGGPLEQGKKTPDLDKTIEMAEGTPTVMDVSEVEASEASTSSKKKKSKLTRKARCAKPSTSTPTAGQKEAVLQEALAEIQQEQAVKEAEAWKLLA